MKKPICLFLIAMLASGCATTQTPVASPGKPDSSDAEREESYQKYSQFTNSLKIGLSETDFAVLITPLIDEGVIILIKRDVIVVGELESHTWRGHWKYNHRDPFSLVFFNGELQSWQY